VAGGRSGWALANEIACFDLVKTHHPVLATRLPGVPVFGYCSFLLDILVFSWLKIPDKILVQHPQISRIPDKCKRVGVGVYSIGLSLATMLPM